MESWGERLMDLIGASVTPATWRKLGKAWSEWLSLVGARQIAQCAVSRLEVTADHLLFLRSTGCLGLSGVAFYFRLLGWTDVTKAF